MLVISIIMLYARVLRHGRLYFQILRIFTMISTSRRPESMLRAMQDLTSALSSSEPASQLLGVLSSTPSDGQPAASPLRLLYFLQACKVIVAVTVQHPCHFKQ